MLWDCELNCFRLCYPTVKPFEYRKYRIKGILLRAFLEGIPLFPFCQRSPGCRPAFEILRKKSSNAPEKIRLLQACRSRIWRLFANFRVCVSCCVCCGSCALPSVCWYGFLAFTVSCFPFHTGGIFCRRTQHLPFSSRTYDRKKDIQSTEEMSPIPSGFPEFPFWSDMRSGPKKEYERWILFTVCGLGLDIIRSFKQYFEIPLFESDKSIIFLFYCFPAYDCPFTCCTGHLPSFVLLSTKSGLCRAHWLYEKKMAPFANLYISKTTRLLFQTIEPFLQGWTMRISWEVQTGLHYGNRFLFPEHSNRHPVRCLSVFRSLTFQFRPFLENPQPKMEIRARFPLVKTCSKPCISCLEQACKKRFCPWMSTMKANPMNQYFLDILSCLDLRNHSYFQGFFRLYRTYIDGFFSCL